MEEFDGVYVPGWREACVPAGSHRPVQGSRDVNY